MIEATQRLAAEGGLRLSRPLVIAEDERDFKYRQVVERMPVEYRHVKYSRFILWLLRPGTVSKNRNTYFHIRYLKWRGWLRSIPVYLVLVTLCRLRGVRIVWTLHCVWEHFMPSRRQNALLRQLVSRAADKIIVMHPKVALHLPPSQRRKVLTANFGTFRPAVERAALEATPNHAFTRRFNDWRHQLGIGRPDIVMVSASVLEANDLFDFLEDNPDLSGLVIGAQLEERSCGPNVLLIRERVYAEVDAILRGDGIVGYCPNDNVSVPTSIYTFAAYGIPLIGKDVSPVCDILGDSGVGGVYNSVDEMRDVYEGIMGDYAGYRARCSALLAKDTWDASADVHRQVFA